MLEVIVIVLILICNTDYKHLKECLNRKSKSSTYLYKKDNIIHKIDFTKDYKKGQN